MKGQRSHVNDPGHRMPFDGNTKHELDVHDIRNDGVSHEEGDINVGPVYKFMICLGVFMVISYFIVYGIMKWNDARMDRENEITSHLSKSKSEQLPPEPRLQLAPGHADHPLDEGIRYRDSVIHVLETYGYLNKATGSVHIPIDLAKDVLLKKGLPVRAAQTPETVPAVMIPEFSSSGRTYIARDQRTPGGTFTVTGGNLNVRSREGDKGPE